MKYFIYLLFFSYLINGYDIKNYNRPICASCKYFKPINTFDKKDAIKYGQCKKYGEKNLLSGNIEYEFASIARKYLNCGINGTHYQYDSNYMWKYQQTYFKILLTVSPFIIIIILYYYIM